MGPLISPKPVMQSMFCRITQAKNIIINRVAWFVGKINNTGLHLNNMNNERARERVVYFVQMQSSVVYFANKPSYSFHYYICSTAR